MQIAVFDVKIEFYACKVLACQFAERFLLIFHWNEAANRWPVKDPPVQLISLITDVFITLTSNLTFP